MSYSTLIIGESGTGKTCSLRNLNPAITTLIQPVRKPLPFPAKGWREIRQKGDGGNIFVTENPDQIMWAMKLTKSEIIVVDDWQYILSNMYMNRRKELGYNKFADMAAAGFDICRLAYSLAPNKRVYVLAHSHTDENGHTAIKTLGKMLDEKIVIEGLFTSVLKTHVENGVYQFQVHNSGNDTVKSPMGLFQSDYIENDLAMVDKAICSYYGIPQ